MMTQPTIPRGTGDAGQRHTSWCARGSGYFQAFLAAFLGTFHELSISEPATVDICFMIVLYEFLDGLPRKNL